MSESPAYPLVYCDREDRSCLHVFGSLEEAVATLEILEVEDQEHDAWDAAGFRLRLVSRGPRASDWLQISRVAATPEVDEGHLFDLVRTFARLHSIDTTAAPGESLLLFYRRCRAEIERRRWLNRPWWLRLLNLPNP